MRYRLHGRKFIGPFFIAYGKRGITSYGIKIGPFTWNLKRGTKTIDTPGPGSVEL